MYERLESQINKNFGSNKPKVLNKITTTGWEEFEDTKEVIRIRKPKKDRQHNGKEKKWQKGKQDPRSLWNHLVVSCPIVRSHKVATFIIPANQFTI